MSAVTEPRRPFIYVDTEIWSSPAALKAGPRAVMIHIHACCWLHQYGHPDVVPFEWYDRVRVLEEATDAEHEALVAAGIWERTDQGWIVSDFGVKYPPAPSASSPLARIAGAIDGHACAYCGGDAEHWDHVIPRAQGGLDVASNLVPACEPCNLSKAARTPEQWWTAKHPGKPFPPDWPRAGALGTSTACPG